MHSTLVRAQNVFGFFTTVVFFLSALIALSVVFFPQHPSAELTLRNIQVVKGRPHYYSSKREEYAHIKFDLDADLSSLFNWNTKQVFIYVVAQWPSSPSSSSPTSNITLNEAVIWDQILPSASSSGKPSSSSTTKASPAAAASSKPGVIHLRNVKPKYQITHPSGLLSNANNVSLLLEYNVQPWVGALVWSATHRRLAGRWAPLVGGRSQPFDFPAVKGAAAAAKQKKEGL